MNDKTFNIISNGICTSLVNYCISVYGNIWLNNEDKNRRFKAFSKEDCRRLQVLQNKVLRLKLRASQYTLCIQLITQSGDLSIHQLVDYHTIIQVQTTVLSKKPAYLSKNLALKALEVPYFSTSSNSNNYSEQKQVYLQVCFHVSCGQNLEPAASTPKKLSNNCKFQDFGEEMGDRQCNSETILI